MPQDAMEAGALEAGVERLGAGLSDGDARLRRALIHAPAPVMLFDESGRVLLVSRAWLDLTGYTAEELRTIEDWSACLHGAEAERMLCHLREAVRTEPSGTPVEFGFDTRDGQRRYWSAVASALGPLPDGRRLFICIATDITERKRAEATARESERRFRDVVEALPGAVYTTDADGRITLYNEAAARLWGHRPTPGQDRWCGSWRLYWPDGRPMAHAECPMAVALRENRAIAGAEAAAERPDGTRVPFLAYPTPLRDGAGALVGAVNMLVDITERKRAETRLELLAGEVDHRAKNMLAVIQAVVSLTRAATVADFAAAIGGRIAALARAHSLLSDSRWAGADLERLVAEELAPYRRGEGTRVRLAGPRVALSPAAAQSLAMTLHELATNAAKHGALGAAAGRVRLDWRRDAAGRLALRWRESGGPPVRRPERPGFGLAVVERTVADQLDGTVRFDWAADGLRCDIDIPPKALAQA